MDLLTKRERELVAIGASLASNCVPCIDHHIKEARAFGITDAEIREAVELAKFVKDVPAKKVLDYAYSKLKDEPSGTGEKS